MDPPGRVVDKGGILRRWSPPTAIPIYSACFQTTMSLDPGARLGHYDVTALIGEGGMGQVWQATGTNSIARSR